VRIQNDTAGQVVIAGVIFEAGELRELDGVASSSELFGAFVDPLGKTLAQALDDGDVSAPGSVVVAPAMPGDIARAASVAYVVDAAREGGAYNFRGEVANVVDLAGFVAPEEGDHAAVQTTGTLFRFDGTAWEDTGINASFQDWIPAPGPSPLPVNNGTISPDLSYSFNVAFSSAVGSVYRIGPITASGYNYAGFASEQVISQAGDYFEFPSLVVSSNIQGLGLASTDTLNGSGPNENGVATPGVFCTPPSNFFAYTGRDVMGYFKPDGLFTTGAQNGGALVLSQPTAAERAESGAWSTGGRVRVGLDDQYHFFIATYLPVAQVWKTLFRSTTPMPTQAYRFCWVGNYTNSVLSQLPNQVVTPPPPGGYSDLFFVRLDGFNEYVDAGTQASLSNVLNYGQPWAFGCKIATDWNPLGVPTPAYTLLKNGANAVYLNPGSNTQPYITAGSARAGANTFRSVAAGDNLLFQSSGTSIQFYVNGALRWSTTISAAVQSASAPTGQLTIGEAGPISSFLQGGIDNVWFMDRPLIGAETAEAGLGGNPQDWSFYSELLAFYLMGEGGPAAFPNIADLTGQVPDAVLVNGEPTDFEAY